MKYEKLPLKIEEQLELLNQRGLIIDDEEEAAKYLKNISYYHLSAYFKSFQDQNDNFHKNITFSEVLNVYIFDKKLRLLLFDMLERIEKSFKCRLVYEVSVKYNDSHWLSDSQLFEEGKYEQYVLPLSDKIRKSREESIRHYYDKYNEPDFPPVWTAIDSLTFGEVVTIYRTLNTTDRNLVSKTYELDEKILVSWMFGLSTIRNICAHYSRLWNKRILAQVIIAKNYKDYFVQDRYLNNYLYNYLVVLEIITIKIKMDSTWIERLDSVIARHNIDIRDMGFPKQWKENLLQLKNKN